MSEGKKKTKKKQKKNNEHHCKTNTFSLLLRITNRSSKIELTVNYTVLVTSFIVIFFFEQAVYYLYPFTTIVRT